MNETETQNQNVNINTNDIILCELLEKFIFCDY